MPLVKVLIIDYRYALETVTKKLKFVFKNGWFSDKKIYKFKC